MDFPDFFELPDASSINGSVLSSSLTTDDTSLLATVAGPPSKRQKRASSDFEDSGFFSDLGSDGLVAKFEPCLIGIPAELRIRIIRYYLMMNTPYLQGDWSYEKENLPHMSPLWLLSVNKLIRAEALPLAHRILIVLPRYHEITWKGPCQVNSFSSTMLWWSTLETFCVTRWIHLTEAFYHMPNLRRVILNWHYLTSENVEVGMGTSMPSQEKHLRVVSDCVADEHIVSLVLSTSDENPLKSESKRFWAELSNWFPPALLGKVEIQVAATVLVRCGILDVWIDISDPLTWNSSTSNKTLTKINLVRGPKSNPGCCHSLCVGTVFKPDHTKSVPYTYKGRRRSPVTEYDVVQWLCLDAFEEGDLYFNYELMENIDFKKRMWHELHGSTERISYWKFGDFAHSSGCEMLRCGFFSHADFDWDDERNSRFRNFVPWATMVHDDWLPDDHPDYNERLDELIFPEPEHGLEYRGYPIQNFDEEIEQAGEELEEIKTLERRSIEREWERTGKKGFAVGTFECDRPLEFPRLKISKDNKPYGLVAQHDGMAWKRYKMWRGLDL